MNAAAESQTGASVISSQTPPARLGSLDVFRGLTIAAMMLANNAGDWSHVYPPLKHADWHGWTITDTIFPFFIWIVGVAIPLALVRRMEQGESKSKLIIKIVRRSLIIFGIGLFLNGFPFYDFIKNQWMDFSTYRIPGVLQRIAVCYLIASLIVLNTKLRGQIIAISGFLVAYILLMAFGSVPGFPAGDLSKEGNFSHYIDSIVLGKHVYAVAKTWDPEGIVSTLPAIATCLFGVLLGHLLRSKKTASQKISWMFIGGTFLMLAGQLMNLWMPINKPIWTSSYSVFMAGLAAIVFGLCYWLVDVKGFQNWTKPLAIYGMNAITVFVLAGILGRITIRFSIGDGKTPLKTFLYDNLFGWMANPKMHSPPLLRPENASLCWAIMYVVLLYLVAYVLYRKKWFLRV